MAAYNTAFGSLPGYNEMLGKSNTTGGGVQQQTPGAQRPRRMRQPGQEQGGYQTEQIQPRQTFAQMQQQGQARPAPPMGGQPMGGQPMGNQPMGGFGQGGFGRTPQAQDLQGQLQRSLSQGLSQPSAYNTDTFNQLRASQAANLQAEYTGQQQALDEELAARGLYASSIGGGRMGDLAGQQARAMSSLDAQLLQQFATTQAADRLAAQRAAQEYATQQQTTALKAGELTGTFGGQDTLAAREMANQKALQEAALTGVYGGTKTLAAEQQANAQRLAEAGLTGQYGGQQTLAGRQQAEEQRQFNVQQALASQLGLGNLGVAQQEVGIKQQALSQQEADAAAERSLRERLQTGQITAEKAQQERSIEAQKKLQTEQLSLERDKLNADKDFRADQLGLNRDELDVRANQIKEDQRLKGVEIDNEQAYRNAEIDARTTQIENEYKRSGEQIDVDSARIQAQKDISKADNDAQMARLVKQTGSQEKIAGNQLDVEKLRNAYQQAAALSEQSGYQYQVDPAGNVVQVKDAQGKLVQTSAVSQANLARSSQENISKADNEAQMARLVSQTGSQEKIAGNQLDVEKLRNAYQQAAALSEQSGVQYEVDASGRVVQVRGANGTPMQTSAVSQANAARSSQENMANLDRQLRQQLGMTEATGDVYMTDANNNVVRATGAQAGTTVQAKQYELQKQQQLYQQAEMMSQMSGSQYTVADGRIVRTNDLTVAEQQRAEANRQALAGLTGIISGTQTLQSKQYNLQAGQAAGTVYNPITGLNERTVESRSAEAQQNLANLDRQLRQQLGMMEATGNVYTTDQYGNVFRATGSQAGTTIAAQQLQQNQNQFTSSQSQQAEQFKRSQAQNMAQFLSEQTGQQYGVGPDGGVVPLNTGQDSLNKQRVGIERTSAEAASQLANSQMFMQLAQILSSLTQGTNTANLSDAMGTQLGLVKDASGRWVPKSAKT
jgi:hypothetical protein